MRPPALVLLAAGLSTRFGRPKAVEPLGPDGEALLDYAIVDALRAGFGRVVIVTAPGLKETLCAHVEGTLGAATPIDWALQRLDTLPAGFRPPAGRRRPWGTAHALIAARPWLEGSVGVANADDWYGPDAYLALARFLARGPSDEAALVGFRMADTLSAHGGVSRAWVRSERGRVSRVEEMRDVRRHGSAPGSLWGRDPSGAKRSIPEDAWTSMNLWGLPPATLDGLVADFREFLQAASGDLEAEFPLSGALDWRLERGELVLELLPEGREWFGVTFADDAPNVRRRLRALHERGTYPTPLRRALL